MRKLLTDEELLELGLVYIDSELSQDGYAWQRSVKDANFQRLLNGQAYWPAELQQSVRKFKKLILNFSPVLIEEPAGYGPNRAAWLDKKKLGSLPQDLIRHGFKLFIRTEPGILQPIDENREFFQQLQGAQLLKKPALIAELADCNKETQEYAVLDAQDAINLRQKINKKKVKYCLTFGNANDFTGRNNFTSAQIRQLCTVADTDSLSLLTYFLERDEPNLVTSLKTSLTWSGDFNSKNLQKLLSLWYELPADAKDQINIHLKEIQTAVSASELDDVFLEKLTTPNVPSREFFSTKLFSHLVELNLLFPNFEKSPTSFQDFLDFDTHRLKKLRSLTIENFHFQKNLSFFVFFEKLTKLDLIDCPNLGFPNAPNRLEDLSLKGNCYQSIFFVLTNNAYFQELKKLSISCERHKSLDFQIIPLVLCFPKMEILALWKFPGCSSLTIEKSPRLKEAHLEELKNCQKLSFSNCEKLSGLYTTNLNDLQQLTVKDCENLSQISIIKGKPLKGAKNFGIKYISLINCLKLSSLHIYTYDELTIDITNCPCLNIEFLKSEGFIVQDNGSGKITLFKSRPKDTENVEAKSSSRIPLTIEGSSFNSEESEGPFLASADDKVDEKEDGNGDIFKPYQANAEKYRFDANTASQEGNLIVGKIFHVRGDDKTLECPVNHYRFDIYTGLEVDENDCIYAVSLAFDEADLESVSCVEPLRDRPIYDCIIPLSIKKDEWVALPGLSANDRLVEMESSNFIIARAKSTGQYWVKLKPEAGFLYNGPFQFTIQKDPNYLCEKIIGNVDDRLKIPRQSPKIVNIFTEFMGELTKGSLIKDVRKRKFSEAHHAFLTVLKKGQNELLTKSEIANSIATLCRSFKSVELDKKGATDLENFKNLLYEGKGVCRHFGQMYMALCHYFRIPARMIRNKCHVFNETPVQVSNQSQPHWQGSDLGGGTRLNVEERVLYQPKQSLHSEKPLTRSKASNNEAEDQKKSDDQQEQKLTEKNPHNQEDSDESDSDEDESLDLWKARLLGEPDWIDDCDTFQEFVRHAIKEKNPVIRIPDKKDIFKFDELVIQSLEAKEEKKEEEKSETMVAIPHLSLHSAAEIQAKYTTTKIVDNDCVEVAGPLQQMMQGTYGPAVEITYWSQFTPHQQLVLKTKMDDPPTLNDTPIDKRVTVLGVLAKDEPTSEIFLSRATEIFLPKKFSPVKQPLPQRSWLIDARINKELVPTDAKIRAVDLYHSKEWYSLLVEQLKIENDSFIFKPGALLESMNSPLIIKNAPTEDPTFQLFWHQFTTANGKLLLHDETFTPGENFKIYLSETQSVLAKSLVVHHEHPTTTEGTTYVINRGTYPQLFDMQQIDSNGIVHPVPGILDQYRDGDQIVIQDDIFNNDSSQQHQLPHLLQYISDYTEQLNAKFKKNTEYHVYVDTKQENKKEQVLPLQRDKNLFIETHDEMFVIDALVQEQKLSNENIFYLGNQSAWSALIEQVTYERIRDPSGHLKIRAKRIELDFLKKLRQGETVVISDGLTLENYLQLQTLFCEKPYLMVNGVRENITGKIIWVYPKQGWQPPLPHVIRNPVLKEYKDRVGNELKLTDSSIVDKVTTYFEYFEGFEKDKKLTYSQFKAMVLSTSDLSRENSIKPVIQFHYAKNTEKYAYLNVLGKLIFSRTDESHVRIDKLNKILEELNKYPERSNDYFWRIANCFSGKTLREFFWWDSRPFIDSLFARGPEIFVDGMSRLRQSAVDSVSLKQLDPSQTSYEKQKERLLTACEDPKKRIILLRGEAGTGKTEAVETLEVWLNERKQKNQISFGLKNIGEWLTPAPKGVYKKLILEEFDLKQPGTWARLRGLFGNPPIYRDDQGKCHTLSEQHQVIAIGNPPDYKDRKFHKEFWEHATSIWFSPFSETVVRNKIQDYLNKNKISHNELLNNFIFECYVHLRANKHCITKVTLGRDLKNFVARIGVFIEENGKENLSEEAILNLARRAAYEEFSGIISIDQARADFQNFLKLNNNDLIADCQGPIVSLKDLKITPEKMATLDTIRRDLAIHKKRILNDDDTMGKAGLLVEGPSGIGKSSMVLALLESLGYSFDAIDTQKRVYYLAAGSKNAEGILRKAFQEGATVVYDELNYDFSVHELLNHFLTGKDECNQKPVKIGFTLIGTQNPGYKSIPEDLLSRLHKINMNGYSDDELLRLAKEYKVEKLPQAYFGLRKQKRPGLNPRHFFKIAKQYTPTRTLLKEKPSVDSGKFELQF